MKGTLKPSLKLSDIISLIPTEHLRPQIVEITFNERKFSIAVKSLLTLTDYASFIHHVASNVFVNETNESTGKTKQVYSPALKEIAIARAVLAFYTDMDIDTDAEALYLIMNATSLVDDIIANIKARNANQFDSLMRDVIEEINERRSRQDSGSLGLSDMFEMLTHNISQQMQDPDFLKQYVDEVIEEEMSVADGKD